MSEEIQTIEIDENVTEEQAKALSDQLTGRTFVYRVLVLTDWEVDEEEEKAEVRHWKYPDDEGYLAAKVEPRTDGKFKWTVYDPYFDELTEYNSNVANSLEKAKDVADQVIAFYRAEKLQFTFTNEEGTFAMCIVPKDKLNEITS